MYIYTYIPYFTLKYVICHIYLEYMVYGRGDAGADACPQRGRGDPSLGPAQRRSQPGAGPHGDGGDGVRGSLFGAEISNPALQIRWFMLEAGLKDSPFLLWVNPDAQTPRPQPHAPNPLNLQPSGFNLLDLNRQTLTLKP